MKTHAMLSIFRRHTLEAFSQVMAVAVSLRKWQKQFEYVALHLKGTLERPPIYD